MISFWRLLLGGALFTAIFAAGAILHERDIALACARHGNSGAAGWTISITCQVGKSDQGAK